MKRKLPEKFFEQNQRAKTRKWKFFNLNQTLWGAGNREFRFVERPGFVLPWKRGLTNRRLFLALILFELFNGQKHSRDVGRRADAQLAA